MPSCTDMDRRPFVSGHTSDQSSADHTFAGLDRPRPRQRRQRSRDTVLRSEGSPNSVGRRLVSTAHHQTPRRVAVVTQQFAITGFDTLLQARRGETEHARGKSTIHVVADPTPGRQSVGGTALPLMPSITSTPPVAAPLKPNASTPEPGDQPVGIRSRTESAPRLRITQRRWRVKRTGPGAYSQWVGPQSGRTIDLEVFEMAPIGVRDGRHNICRLDPGETS